MPLLDITPANWREFSRLAVACEQSTWVATPSLILARAFVYREHGARVWGITDAEQPTGLVSGYRQISPTGESWWYVDQLLVDAGHQRRGLGSHALTAMVEFAREHELAGVLLCCLESNHPVQTMVARAGFIRRAEWDDGDEIVWALAFDAR